MIDAEIVEAAPLVPIASSKDDHFDAGSAADRTATLLPGLFAQCALDAVAGLCQRGGMRTGLAVLAENQELVVIHDRLEGAVQAAAPAVEVAQRLQCPLFTANQILGAERGVPISNKVRDAIKPQMGKSQQAMFDYVARVSKDAQPVPPADPPGATDVINNVYKPLIDQVLFEQLPPDQAAKQLRDQANAILAKNKK